MSVFGQTRRSKQMGVHVSDAATEQLVALHHLHDFFMGCDGGLVQQSKIGQYGVTTTKIAQRDFADNKWMT